MAYKTNDDITGLRETIKIVKDKIDYYLLPDQIKRKNEGGISSDGNRIIWKIPRFDIYLQEQNKHTLFSPIFTIADRSWDLFTRFESSLDIGVYQVTNKIGDFKVRLGITKGNLEFSSFGVLSCGGTGSFEFMNSSNFDNLKDHWLCKGNLCLSFAIEEFIQEVSKNAPSQDTTDKDLGKLQNDLEFLLNGNFSDIIVRVVDKEFKCHRSILAARSPVFLAMLTHDTKEKTTGTIQIDDAHPKPFSDFLYYLYTGSMKKLNRDNVLDFYTLSDKYQTTELNHNCLKYMQENISIETFCDIVDLSLRHNEMELTQACTQFFKETWNSLDIIKTSKWQAFMSENTIACNELLIKLLESKKSCLSY